MYYVLALLTGGFIGTVAGLFYGPRLLKKYDPAFFQEYSYEEL